MIRKKSAYIFLAAFLLIVAVAFWCLPACGQIIEVAAFSVVKETSPAPEKDKPALQKVVHRSGRNWTDPGVGRWTVETITLHLMGEIESPQHRGKVPLDQLQGRSLKELIAIHANLHEGFQWNGQPYPKQTQPYCPPGGT